MHIIVTTDGSTRPTNPGPMEIGGLCRTEDDIVLGYFNKKLGNGTNNTAECMAALHGVRLALSLKAKRITLEVDSKLIHNQLAGVFRVRKPLLRKIKTRIMTDLNGMPFKVVWARRTEGARPIADALSRNNTDRADKLIAEMYPLTDSGSMHFWEDMQDVEDIELEGLDMRFHKFDMTG